MPESLTLILAVAVALVAVALFLVVQKVRAGVVGHVPSAGSLSRRGGAAQGKSGKDSEESKEHSIEDRLILKRELLEQWAKNGKTIDDVAEALAEFMVLEVEERGGRWRDLTAAALNEPTEDVHDVAAALHDEVA